MYVQHTCYKNYVSAHISGRMALLVTLFLVLVNIFNSVTANAPKSEGLTAVETWVVMCILHVFCVLAEYAIILKIIQGNYIVNLIVFFLHI